MQSRCAAAPEHAPTEGSVSFELGPAFPFFPNNANSARNSKNAKESGTERNSKQKQHNFTATDAITKHPNGFLTLAKSSNLIPKPHKVGNLASSSN